MLLPDLANNVEVERLKFGRKQSKSTPKNWHFLPDPLVWSLSGPVSKDHVDPVRRVQSKTSEQDCRQPLQSPMSKSQDKLVGAENVTRGQLFLFPLSNNLFLTQL